MVRETLTSDASGHEEISLTTVFLATAGRNGCFLGDVKRLLLWDIDGTLIDSGGAGRRALQAALRTVFGLDGSLADISLAGRTDRSIMRSIFQEFGVPATAENFARYTAGYVAALSTELHRPGARILPGIRELLHAIRCDGQFAQGLLTGNLRRGAEAKLAPHGLWEHFPFGAFGDDGEHRRDLAAHALCRARERHGVDFAGAQIWIIGDTEYDIDCGRAIGARTLAVGTGVRTVAQLEVHRPTALRPDLADTAAVLRLLAG